MHSWPTPFRKSDPGIMTTPLSSPIPGQACQVLSAVDVYVSHGVNAGDPLGGPEEVCLGDVYRLDDDHRPLRLSVGRPEGSAGGSADGRVQRVAQGSEVGREGEEVFLEACYSLMGTDGGRVELLVLALPGGLRFALPLSPMAAMTDYSLLKIEAAPKEIGLADLMCVSFARGTMITLGSGLQRPIEQLISGDRVLTRDHGCQPVRWVGQATLRAVGAFAPVVITKGTLANSGDLIVSQHHRMFLYQRNRKAGLATSEVLVQARHLVDDERVFLREGGYVDYFSLVFDQHEIVYAEGVPAESLMVNETTVNRLPAALSDEMKARFPGLSQNQHFGTEAGRQFLDQVGPQTLFQTRAATGAR